jgi:tryptophanase
MGLRSATKQNVSILYCIVTETEDYCSKGFYRISNYIFDTTRQDIAFRASYPQALKFHLRTDTQNNIFLLSAGSHFSHIAW